MARSLLIVRSSSSQRPPVLSVTSEAAASLTFQAAPPKSAKPDPSQGSNDFQALIDSGLAANEQVVVDGQYKLQPGSHVTILHGKAAAEAAAQSAQQIAIP